MKSEEEFFRKRSGIYGWPSDMKLHLCKKCYHWSESEMKHNCDLANAVWGVVKPGQRFKHIILDIAQRKEVI